MLHVRPAIVLSTSSRMRASDLGGGPRGGYGQNPLESD